MTNAQAQTIPKSPSKDAVRKCREMYLRKILPKIKDDHYEECVAIDIATGEWEIADTTYEAVERLQERCPDAFHILYERVGFRADYNFGRPFRWIEDPEFAGKPPPNRNPQKESQIMTNIQTPTGPTMPLHEIVRLGREIYKRDILPKVRDDHFGEYVAVDAATGEWEIAGSTREAVDRLKERCPNAVDLLCERVGYRAIRSFGGGAILEDDE